MSKSNGEVTSYSGPFDPKRALRFILVIVIAGLVMIFIQSLQLGVPSQSVNQATIMLAVAGAAMSLGGLVGFLFGVPRRLQKEGLVNPPKTDQDGEAAQRLLYEGNTNLEQISDWLTKLIVGVTLVEFTNIVAQLQSYGAGIADATKRPSDQVFAIGIMLFFFITGFLVGYLWSRLYLGRALTAAEYQEKLEGKISDLEQEKDVLERQRHEAERQENANAAAMSFVRNQLAPDSEPSSDRNKAKELLENASKETKAHIFYMAENNRWANWRENKRQMERSIVVFEGLIAIDKEMRYHRNYGQLAYCMKDKTEPDLKRSEELLTMAIRIRGPAADNGWRIYEANRAYVRILLLKQGNWPDGIAVSPEVAIADDLKEGLADYWAAQWLGQDEDVMAWAADNSFTMNSAA